MILDVPERHNTNRHLKQREIPTAGGVFLSTDDINLYRLWLLSSEIQILNTSEIYILLK